MYCTVLPTFGVIKNCHLNNIFLPFNQYIIWSLINPEQFLKKLPLLSPPFIPLRYVPNNLRYEYMYVYFLSRVRHATMQYIIPSVNKKQSFGFVYGTKS